MDFKENPVQLFHWQMICASGRLRERTREKIQVERRWGDTPASRKSREREEMELWKLVFSKELVCSCTMSSSNRWGAPWQQTMVSTHSNLYLWYLLVFLSAVDKTKGSCGEHASAFPGIMHIPSSICRMGSARAEIVCSSSLNSQALSSIARSMLPVVTPAQMMGIAISLTHVQRAACGNGPFGDSV